MTTSHLIRLSFTLINKPFNWCKSFLVSVLLICPTLSFAQNEALNPDFFYFFNGKTQGNWQIILGDEDNYMLAVTTDSAESAGKRVSLSRADYQATGDALSLKWSRKKGRASFALYGANVDLSALEDKAALTLELKVIKKPKGTISLGMDCSYPCRGEMNIHKMLRDFELDKWTTFPIPINCFKAKGLDLSKVNAPILLSADQPFEIEIANIRLELLPEGAPTCAS